jgi:hypothetical protein
MIMAMLPTDDPFTRKPFDPEVVTKILTRLHRDENPPNPKTRAESLIAFDPPTRLNTVETARQTVLELYRICRVVMNESGKQQKPGIALIAHSHPFSYLDMAHKMMTTAQGRSNEVLNISEELFAEGEGRRFNFVEKDGDVHFKNVEPILFFPRLQTS